MTHTGRNAHGRHRPDGEAATRLVPGKPRRNKKSRRLIAGGLAAATATGGLFTFAATSAHAGNPPTAGNIEIFAARDMVALEGYVDQAGQTATVTVTRGNTVIGTGTGVIDATGFLEFNHPGGSCWSIVTPDIRGGDLIEARFSGSEIVEGAVTSSVTIPKITTPEGEVVTATFESPNESVNGFEDGHYWLKIAGTYDPTQLQPAGETTLSDPKKFLNPSRFGVEIVNPAMREAGSTVGERAIGWNPGPVDPAEAPTTYRTDGSFNPDGTFVAYFGLQTEADRDLAMAGEHVGLSWMADSPDPNVELQSGLSLYEAGETNGPGFGECPPGPGNQDPVAPSQAALTTFDGNGDIKVDWLPPTQPTDANDLIGYRVSAIDTSVTPQQEVSIEVDGTATTATLQGLNVGQEYPIEIEADNGQWSDPVSVGSATPGTAGTTGSTGGGGGVVTPPTDTAPTNVAATAPTVDSVVVTWTAAAGATSYEVSLTGPGAPSEHQTVTDTTATFTGLTAGATYTAAVTAIQGDTRTPAAATAEVTTPTAVAPGAARVTRTASGHESIAVEWLAATPGNDASPVTGYDLVATPSDGQPAVTTSVGAVTTGTIGGLRNGIAYTVVVFAKSGSLVGPESINGLGVAATVTPNDVVTVSRAEFRANRTEWRVQGSALDTTANSVTLYVWNGTSRGQLIGTAAVGADGAWSFNQRNTNVSPTANNQIEVVSTSGGRIVTSIQRVR
ncbi:fibronectin type III domain-containing protein [Trujillonella humicola]|uniref:fibronectin type III domain-containing protein n=1 Tax=Trujillonella humicola TaxID=3383699 RepID=UPI0039060F2C